MALLRCPVDTPSRFEYAIRRQPKIRIREAFYSISDTALENAWLLWQIEPAYPRGARVPLLTGPVRVFPSRIGQRLMGKSHEGKK